MRPLRATLIRSTSLYDLFEEDYLFSGKASPLGELPTAQEVAEFIHRNPDDVVSMRSAYNKAGIYIGSDKDAEHLCDQRDITPEALEGQRVCCFGKSTDGKWYGWSHRAIFGFTIGSACKKGDCHYIPANEKDAIEDGIRFWSNPDYKRDVRAGETAEVDELGRRGVRVFWDYSDAVPNEKLRGTTGSAFHAFPDEWGKGEWTAETEEDGRQMAIDFANGVS